MSKARQPLSNGLEKKSDQYIRLSNGVNPEDPENYEQDYEQSGNSDDGESGSVKRAKKSPQPDRGYSGRG
jgi:hypothetical protein